MKKKTAQELIEFLLIAPFLIIIFGIITEYAYALNTNLTLTNGLKTVTASLYSNINSEMTSGDIKELLNEKLSDFMKSNYAPCGEDNNLNVEYSLVNDSAIVVASYKYVSAFTLPNLYIHFLPEQFNFSASIVIPSAFLKPNNYNNISSRDLDKIWVNSGTEFSSFDIFNASKRGIMTNTSAGGSTTSNILFLVPATTALGENVPTYAIVRWNGTRDNDEEFVNLSDGRIYTCTDDACTNTTAFANRYNPTNLFCVNDFIPPIMDILSEVWVMGNGKLSDNGVDGILKQTLALIDEESKLASGSYDNLDASSYNAEASSSNKYTVDTLGSYVIVHTAEDNINSIINTASPQDINHDFGTRVNKL